MTIVNKQTSTVNVYDERNATGPGRYHVAVRSRSFIYENAAKRMAVMFCVQLSFV